MSKYFLRIIVLVFVLLQFSCDLNSQDKRQVYATTKYLAVTKVVDGDTFWADNGSKSGVKIRLIGIDAPESRKTGKKEIGYYGKEAKAYLKEMLTGKRVKLVRDVDSLDRYGRTLSYVYLQDGTFVNAELIKNGYATVMTFPPNVRFADLFVDLQREARKNRSGIWIR